MALRRRRLAAAAVAYTTVLGGLCGFAVPVRAATWIEQAQAEFTCTGLADAAERASLAAPWLPGPLDAKSVAAYFRGPPQDARQARFRHLTMLAAIGWWADQINDQSLRSDVYVNIGVLADQYAGTGEALFRQVARCARARLIGALLELDQPRVAERVADDLVRLYTEALPVQPVEDWPLLLAIRELRLAPTASASPGLAGLTTRATTFATNSTTAKSPERTSRWLAVASQGVLALGDAGKARDLALQSLVVTGKPPTPVAAWRAMPMLFDAATRLNGAAEAANLHVLLQPDDPPAALRDPEAAFESLLRISQAAETQQRFDDMARLQQSAFNRLARLAELDRYSMPFYRHALDELAGTR
ncbi:MAG: hypothetical protein NDI84_12425, partial [Steroidobacteraceae bacterium]|nr:hypothetical protein [Steroidobacteraceae bacterium]